MLLLALALCVASAASYTIEEDQVTFYLHTKSEREVLITDDNFDVIDGSKVFHFIVHGWISSHSTHFVQDMTDAYLEKDDCNVIQVDWLKPAAEPVYVSANNTKAVGYFVGAFINRLIERLSVAPENINLVGHSFGAQVVGFAGKEVKSNSGKKVGRITVTDAARRPFESSTLNDDERLTSADASVVVGIHTDAGVKGFLGPIGTIDFYPNGGGDPQPGCEEASDTHACSHNIAPEFLIESIRNSEGFKAVKCDSYESYVSGDCAGNDEVAMGGDVASFQGVFYFETNPQPPYSKN